MSEDFSQIFNNLKNLMNDNSIKNTSNNIDNSQSNSNSNFNITPEMIAELSNKLNQINHSKENSETNREESSQIDIDTILKIKTLMEKLNKKDDPRSNLLHSLKPYLRESRQQKIDNYSNLLKIASLSDLFKKND